MGQTADWMNSSDRQDDTNTGEYMSASGYSGTGVDMQRYPEVEMAGGIGNDTDTDAGGYAGSYAATTDTGTETDTGADASAIADADKVEGADEVDEPNRADAF